MDDFSCSSKLTPWMRVKNNITIGVHPMMGCGF